MVAIGTCLPSEKQQGTDPDTGRAVTTWTDGRAFDVGLYYHQNAFDALRDFLYFVSNRTGRFEVWRAELPEGRLRRVSDFEGLGEYREGLNEKGSTYNYWVHVSRVSGRICVGGMGRIGVIDPDTLRCETIWDERGRWGNRDERYHRECYVFPSCDDRWVYCSSCLASDREYDAAKRFAEAVVDARRREGLAVWGAVYAVAPHGLLESPLEHEIFRIEVATGKVQSLWRGHWWIQHVQASPTDPDLACFCWAALKRPKPKYFFLRAGGEPKEVLRDELDAYPFHDFWHPDGSRWYAHSLDNLEPIEACAPRAGKFRYRVHEVDVRRLLERGTLDATTWYETAGKAHMHAHLNIAPDGSYLVGDGAPQTPHIGRLEWAENATLVSSPLCRAGYPEARPYGCECNPNVQVWPDGSRCFFTTHAGGNARLACVEL